MQDEERLHEEDARSSKNTDHAAQASTSQEEGRMCLHSFISPQAVLFDRVRGEEVKRIIHLNVMDISRLNFRN